VAKRVRQSIAAHPAAGHRRRERLRRRRGRGRGGGGGGGGGALRLCPPRGTGLRERAAAIVGVAVDSSRHRVTRGLKGAGRATATAATGASRSAAAAELIQLAAATAATSCVIATGPMQHRCVHGWCIHIQPPAAAAAAAGARYCCELVLLLHSG
jgi:hypothetical protein